MSRQRRFNNIIKVTREQFLFMHNFNSSGGDVWYLNYVVLEHTLLLLYTFTYASTLLSPSLDPAILDQEESCPDPPPPPEQWWSDGVGRAGTVLLLIVRMWLTLGPVLSLYWEQEQGQDHTNTAQSLLIMRLIDYTDLFSGVKLSANFTSNQMNIQKFLE